MGFRKPINIIPLLLVISLLTACLTSDDGVVQEQIEKPGLTTPVNGVAIAATPTPFLPEPATISTVNDDAAIRAALAGRFGVSQDGLKVALAQNTGSHAKGEVGEEYFLAYKDNTTWIIVFTGLANPPCRDVMAAQYPVEMVPECVDEENNQVIRVGETEAAIRIALAERIGVGPEEMELSIIASTGEYMHGRVNNGYFLGVNQNGSWLIVHDGQATPPCKAIDPYPFPTDMVPECLNKNNKLVTR